MSCGPPTRPGYSQAHCTCWSASRSVLLLLSLASRIFYSLATSFRLFCILVLDGQCIVGAWHTARTWCACCLGEPWARASVMNMMPLTYDVFNLSVNWTFTLCVKSPTPSENHCLFEISLFGSPSSQLFTVLKEICLIKSWLSSGILETFVRTAFYPFLTGGHTRNLCCKDACILWL